MLRAWGVQRRRPSYEQRDREEGEAPGASPAACVLGEGPHETEGPRQSQVSLLNRYMCPPPLRPARSAPPRSSHAAFMSSFVRTHNSPDNPWTTVLHTALDPLPFGVAAPPLDLLPTAMAAHAEVSAVQGGFKARGWGGCGPGRGHALRSPLAAR